jgi:integrase/recombinase XerC
MELIQSFLDYLHFEKNYSMHTIKSYQTDLIDFHKFIEEQYQSNINNLNYHQIRTYIVYLSKKNISNRSINRKLSALKTFYKFLMKIGTIQINPLSKHKTLKTPKKVNVPFSEFEIKKVISLFEDYDELDFNLIRDRMIIILLYSTGIRREELVKLKTNDVDLIQGTIKVIGKRNKERVIPLIKSTKNELDRYIKTRETIPNNSDYLFVTEKGKKIYGTFVYRLINYYFSVVTTKVKKSPHIMRHAFATHLINEGADINAVKELLGHASLASTQVYVNSNLKKIKEMYNQAHPRSNKQ